MVRVHRQLLERLGPPPVPAVLLDTPFGFQENAREIAGRAVTYFRESLQATIAVTGLAAVHADPDSAEHPAFADEQLTTAVRDSRYVFAGPGSPSYALRKWQGTVVPSLLVEKLSHGGCVVFASAAALTLGIATVPVYEIYKCGEDPHWLEGLDVTSAVGIRAAIIPHYDNSEGGTHDTRFCYLGERRLSIMEKELPEGAFVLGVDEHTACTFDIEAGTASVEGRGAVTVRVAGRSATLPSGEVLPIARILETAEALARQGAKRETGAQTADRVAETETTLSSSAAGPPSRSPLVDLVREREADFAAAVAFSRHGAGRRRRARSGTGCHRMVNGHPRRRCARPGAREPPFAHLGARPAVRGRARDPRQLVGSFVEALLKIRDAARQDRRFADADFVRERLAESGVEVRDTPDGSEWLLADDSTAGVEAGA